MKKILLGGLAAIFLSLGNSAVAVTPAVPEITTNKNLPSSTINGIDVPYHVLEYVQMKYQGYAVTNVYRSYSGSQRVYVLVVDNEDTQSDNKSINLTYDMNWNLIDDKKVTTPKIYKPIEQIGIEPHDEKEDEREERREERKERKQERKKEIEERLDEIEREIKEELEEEFEDDDSDDGPGFGRGRRGRY